MKSYNGFREGLSNFAQISSADKNWVTAKLIRDLSLLDAAALDDFISCMRSARLAIRGGVSVFLSHSSKDKSFIRPLARYLESHGISVWLDEADLVGGEPLLARLAASVSEVTLMVVVLSRHSVKSNWVTRELSLAMTKELKRRRMTVVPILKDNCRIPATLADKLYIDFRTPSLRLKNRPVLVDSLMKLASAES